MDILAYHYAGPWPEICVGIMLVIGILILRRLPRE